MADGLTGGFATNTTPPSSAAFVDIDRGLVPPVANGGEALPFSTLQSALDAGALRLRLAPGTYGDLVVPAGGVVVIEGDQVLTTAGHLQVSGAGVVLCQGIDCDGTIEITDHAVRGAIILFDCELGISAPITIKGGDVGGVGELQLRGCDAGFANTFSNFRDVLLDDYSERQIFAAGGIFTSTVAGTVGLVSTGSLPNARILLNQDTTLSFARRHVLGVSQLSAARTLTLDMTGIAQNELMTFDTYNNSGHDALVKLGATTLYTATSSATAFRVRFKCSVAGTTAVLDSIERLTSGTL
jgi:hypothetical protein